MRKNTPVAVFPEIDRQNLYLNHALGLEEENVYKQKHSKVPFFAPIYNRWMCLMNYMGRNQSKNDFAWDTICEYSQKD